MTVYTGDANAEDGNWRHVLLSWDLTSTSKRHFYVDDVSASPTWNPYVNQAQDWTTGDRWVVESIGTPALEAVELADLWFDEQTYLDFSQAANRRKFISSAKKPVYLGTDGALPVGAAPLVFLSGDVSAWHTNKGTGGGFTEYGALTAAATSPSD